ncbi:hypothetical protein RYE13_17785 [Clostridioides difficile]|nr:hypothetical protein [Clostridioides difficile]HBG7747383.1 hypothetical protein [Clostridioides difficile]
MNITISVEEGLNLFLKTLYEWNDLPNYVYSNEYKEAFTKCIIEKSKNNKLTKEYVLKLIDHETGNKRPYFEFER